MGDNMQPPIDDRPPSTSRWYAAAAWMTLTTACVLALLVVGRSVVGCESPRATAIFTAGGGSSGSKPAPEKQLSPSSSCEQIWQRKLDKHAMLLAARDAAITNLGPSRDLGERFNYDVFEPTYTCDTQLRRGKPFGDGGKFVCGDPAYFNKRRQRQRQGGAAGAGAGEQNQRCLVYSVGSNGETDFERDVVSSFGCEVHTFDPTGNSSAYERAVNLAGATFHVIGIGRAGEEMSNAVTGKVVKLMPLFDAITLLGHRNRRIDVLKIDCEGCEYEAFSSLWPHIASGDVSIGQILLEIHGTDFQKLKAFFVGASEAGFMIFQKEPNTAYCDGWKCVEYALVHKEEARRMFMFERCGGGGGGAGG